MSYNGYDGGDGEQELIVAANRIIHLDEADTVTKIKQHYWMLGEIMEIAVRRGYTKRLGMRGWIATNLRCSHTHAYDCRNSYRERQQFDEAYRWYQGLNNGWHPDKMTGPRFALEIVKAWRKRGESEHKKLAADTKKKQSHAKDAVEAAKKWEARYVRLRDEHRKLAEFADREPIVLQAIEQEIAAEEAGPSPSQTSQPGLNPPADPVGDADEQGQPTDAPDETQPSAEIAEPIVLPTVLTKMAAPHKPRRWHNEGSQVVATIETNKEPPSGSTLGWNRTETLGQMADRMSDTGLTNQEVDVEASHVD